MDFASEARSGTPLNQRNGTNTIFNGVGWSGAAGVLFKPVRRVSIGVNYIQGETFTMKTRLFGRFLYTVFDPDGSIILSGDEHLIDYVIPDRVAGGVSWRATDSFTVLADVSRVKYAAHHEELSGRRFHRPCGAALASQLLDSRRDRAARRRGVTRLYNRPVTMAFRGGVFTDPDHPLRFVRGGNNPLHPADALLDFRFNTLAAKVNVGVTAGWGIIFGNRVQLDLAATRSPDATEIVASMVLRVR